MFSYVSPESRIPKDHPLRPIREMVDDALKELSADFDVLYSHTGRRQAEREAAVAMLEQLPGEGPKTLGADKAYDTQAFVETLRAQEVTPHVAQNTARAGGSAIDARTTRHEGYAASLKIRKLIETRIGWVKEIGGCAR